MAGVRIPLRVSFRDSSQGYREIYGLSKAEPAVKLSADFGIAGMSSQDLQAVVGAWQSGAISRDTMFELFRSGEILPDGRTNEDEADLIKTDTNPTNFHQPRINTDGHR